jgi:5'(3')-deoxyribonucleotidase
MASNSSDFIELGVDLDEVVFRYLKGIRDYSGRNGAPLPLVDPQQFSLTKSGWFASDEEFKRIHGEAVAKGLYANLEMYENASPVLRDLARSGYRVNIITSRFVNPGQHEIVVKDTARALEANDIPYSNLSFLSNKSMMLMDGYVDDAPHNLEPLIALDRYTVTFDQTYNKHIPGARAANWLELREVLRAKFGR